MGQQIVMHDTSAFPGCGYWRKPLIAVFGCLALLIGSRGMAFGCSLQTAGGGEPDFTLQQVYNAPSTLPHTAYFAIHAHTNASLVELVRVLNMGTAQGTAVLSPVDATTAQTSGVIYLFANQTQHDVGSWITLATQQLKMGPGQKQVVQFRVTIPRDARPGLHLGGISVQAEAVQPPGTTNGTQIHLSVQQRFVIPVEVNVAGIQQSEGLGATGVQISAGPGYQNLLLGLTNIGTDALKPYGSLQVADSQGHPLRNFALKLQTFLPQTSIEYPVNVTGQAFGVGTYQATLILKYGQNHVLDYITTFTVTGQQIQQTFPNRPLQPPAFSPGWPLWISILLIVLAILLIGGASSMIFWRIGMHSTSRTRPRRG